MTGVLIKRGDLETGTPTLRTAGEQEGRDLSDSSTSQRMRKLPASHQKLGDRDEQDLSSKGTNPADTLILDFRPLEL